MRKKLLLLPLMLGILCVVSNSYAYENKGIYVGIFSGYSMGNSSPILNQEINQTTSGFKTSNYITYHYVGGSTNENVEYCAEN